MKYYYKLEDYFSELGNDPETRYLKESLSEVAEKIKKELTVLVSRSTQSRSELQYYWVSRANFGYVFTDFEKPDDIRNIIGVGVKNLFEQIKDDYYCLVLSNTMPYNTREINLGEDRKALIINIDYFRRFRSVISQENFVSLFLYKFDNPEIEKLIRTWIIENNEKFKSLEEQYGITISQIAALIEKYKVHSINELYEMLRISTNALKTKIEENYKLYNERLEKFKDLIDKQKSSDDDTRWNLENEIRDFIKKNPWIVDFTYDEKSVNEEVHEFVDVLLVDSYLGYKKGLLLELKLPSTKTTKKYRTTYAITAAVTDAISQLLDYIIEIQQKHLKHNSNRSTGSFFIDGMIIIGNEMNIYVEILNRYLHNVEIRTYDQLYQDARRRLDAFMNGPAEADLFPA